MKDLGVTIEELELLLSKDGIPELDPYENKDSTYTIPRSKRKRKKKNWFKKLMLR
jgi:hypothetical protein